MPHDLNGPEPASTEETSEVERKVDSALPKPDIGETSPSMQRESGPLYLEDYSLESVGDDEMLLPLGREYQAITSFAIKKSGPRADTTPPQVQTPDWLRDALGLDSGGLEGIEQLVADLSTAEHAEFKTRPLEGQRLLGAEYSLRETLGGAVPAGLEQQQVIRVHVREGGEPRRGGSMDTQMQEREPLRYAMPELDYNGLCVLSRTEYLDMLEGSHLYRLYINVVGETIELTLAISRPLSTVPDLRRPIIVAPHSELVNDSDWQCVLGDREAHIGSDTSAFWHVSKWLGRIAPERQGGPGKVEMAIERGVGPSDDPFRYKIPYARIGRLIGGRRDW